MHDQENVRGYGIAWSVFDEAANLPPAPEMSPEQLLTTYEFGIHEPEYETGGS